MTIVEDKSNPSQPVGVARKYWAQDAKNVAKTDEANLALEDFGSEEDQDWVW